MKYFTQAWASGGLSEQESVAVYERYNRDLAGSITVGSAIRRFATSIGLNDAYVDRVERNISAHSLTLLLLSGSLQIGYWRTELIYRCVVSLEGESALRYALSHRPSEVWYDEFARHGDFMEHGFLLAPRDGGVSSPGEFRIRFSDFDFRQTLASGRSLATPDDRSDWGA